MKQRKFGLSGTALKWIALVCMLLDHTGYILFPNDIWLRIVGRLAFPIYAYMMAEGCRYTRRPWRHFLEVFLMGVVSQVVFQGGEPYRVGIYLNILLTFSVSIALCNGLLAIPKLVWRIFAYLGSAVVLWLTITSLQDMGIEFDYGFWGILLPVTLVLLKEHWQKLIAEGVILSFLALETIHWQWFALAALLLLALYNGTRGSRKCKYVFYLFYPLHLAILYSTFWILYLYFFEIFVKLM